MVAHARIIDRVSSKAYVAHRQIVEAGGGDGVIDLELVAFARAIGTFDPQSPVLLGQDLGELHHRCPCIERRLDVRILKPKRADSALTRLLGGEPGIAATTGDLGSDDLAVADIAAFRAYNHRAASDGLVLTRLKVAENKHVAGFQLDHLTPSNIIHEFNAGSGALHIFHKGGWKQGCWSTCPHLSRDSDDSGDDDRSELHRTVSKVSH